MFASLAKKYREDKESKKLPTCIQEPVDLLKEKLNVNRLLEVASAAVGKQCTGAQAVAAGSFHEVYLLGFVDSSEAIARIIHSYYGADTTEIDLKCKSEKTTLDFIRTHTTVPVPKILYLCSEANGEGVGAPFSIQERIPGTTLCSVFEYGKAANICPEKRKRLIRSLAEMDAQLSSVNLNGIGCLFEDPGGNVVTGEHLCRHNEQHTTKFGPWTSAKDYLESWIQRELNQLTNNPEAWIKQHSELVWDDMVLVEVDVMKRFYKMLLELVGVTEFPTCASGIVHVDWDGLNIMLDEEDCTKVTGIIDWDYSQIRPIWLQGHDWFMSVYPNLASDDLTIEDMRHVRNAAFDKFAPGVVALRIKYRHLSSLLGFATYPVFGQREQVVEAGKRLSQAWPQDLLGSEIIDGFLHSISDRST